MEFPWLLVCGLSVWLFVVRVRGASQDNSKRGKRRGPWIEYWYDEGHRAERGKYVDVIRGHGGICMEKVCIKPTRRIEPGAYWHLGHDHERGGQRDYVGPVHPECNRHEAEQRGVVFDDKEYSGTYAVADDARHLGTRESHGALPPVPSDPWAGLEDPWGMPKPQVPDKPASAPTTMTPKISMADACKERRYLRCKPGLCTCPGAYDVELYERLWAWRSVQAAEEGVPNYVVFTDRTLQLIAEQKPRSAEALLRIDGIGTTKIKWYADAVLALID